MQRIETYHFVNKGSRHFLRQHLETIKSFKKKHETFQAKRQSALPAPKACPKILQLQLEPATIRKIDRHMPKFIADNDTLRQTQAKATPPDSHVSLSLNQNFLKALTLGQLVKN